jgi:hypothetical protein
MTGWSGRAEGLESKEQWIKWLDSRHTVDADNSYRPACKELKPAVRRRITTLSRLVIEPCFEVAAATDTDMARAGTVFAGEHGEIDILKKLFEQINDAEQPSPIDFCNSVHHTATGYLSMGTGNHGISRTVSAGDATFAAGLLETFTLLCSRRCSSVVLLTGDLPVPPAIGRVESYPGFAYGIAAVFALNGLDYKSGPPVTEQDVSTFFKDRMTVFDFLQQQISRLPVKE